MGASHPGTVMRPAKRAETPCSMPSSALSPSQTGTVVRDQPCTPPHLDDALRQRGLPSTDQSVAPRRLEAQADADPASASLRELMDALYLSTTADAGLDPVIGDLRRGRLVRWDAWSTTWEATSTTSGQPHLLRILRPVWHADPWRIRALQRDARALRPALPSVFVLSDSPPAIAAPCPGPAATLPPSAPPPSAQAWLRMVLDTYHHLQRWERSGLGFPLLSPAEIRDDGTALRLCCLTPTADHHAAPAIRHLAAVLLAFWQDGPDDAVVGALQGLAHHPPHRVAVATDVLRRALAERLASHRHQVARRARTASRALSRARLIHAVERLSELGLPPTGRARVGTSLDGKPLLLHSDRQRVTWGPEGQAETVVESGEVDAALVRKVVRHFDAAPISARSAEALGADAELGPRLVRWLIAAQELRTLRLLLR